MPRSLLAGAIRYALGSVECVAPGLLAGPTPCRDWDLAALLRHANDSLAALHEGFAIGHVSLGWAAGDGAPADGLATIFRDRAAQLLAAVSTAGPPDIAIADRRVAAAIVTAVGAVEIAVHGWDVAAACGQGHRRPIPPALATGLLEIVPLIVTESVRGTQFAAPVSVPPLAGPGDRLVALLGRDPGPYLSVATLRKPFL
jgi:uncharacterized protein (TIGR03086 family)